MPYADKEKQREAQRRWVAQRRQVWLDEHGPCARCGSTMDLQVDHVDPAMKIGHRIWSWSDARRDAELAKCQVLCLPCHQAKTAEDYRARAQHGTYAMRRKYGCGCEKCREYVRDDKRRSSARIAAAAVVHPIERDR